MPTLHIQLLGNFRLIYEDILVTTIVQSRLQALLTCLLLHQDSPQSRQHLAFLFWPDTAESQARTNLRQLLHRLRRNLPMADQYLQVDNKMVQWRPDAAYTLDVADFEHDLTQAAIATKEGRANSERVSLESAFQRYQGDLLPGCYDDWILPDRERLSQAHNELLQRLVLLAEEQRDYYSAIGYAQRLLRHDPLHETTYRRLMRLHALHGDRASALRVYHTCVTVLNRELGVEPEADTQDAYRRLLNMEAPPVLRAQSPSTSVIQPSLVGRYNEWNMLRTAWRRAAFGQAILVLISGEPGIGKTRLAEDFLDWAAQQGITIARTRAYAAEGQLAYAPVTELLRTDPLCSKLSGLEDVWLAELARLLPELLVKRPDLSRPEPIADSFQRQRLIESLARAVCSGKRPLLLLLDDLQWYDHDTLEWLHYLMHSYSEAKLLILGAVRPAEVDQDHPLASILLDLRIHEKLTEVELGPLDDGETAALAEQIAGRKLDVDEISRVHVYTEGNPFFVVETIRAEVSGGTATWATGEINADRTLWLSNQSDQQDLTSIKLPPKVQAVIQARLRQLSLTARELAGLAATIGRAFTTDMLVQASESDEETLVRGLDELWRRRIVREQGRNAYDFSHDRIREVAYAEVSPARRKMLHRRIAGVLEQLHEPNLDGISGQIAAHYDKAGLAVQAINYYQRAAGVAQHTFSNTEVIGLLTRALELSPALPDIQERIQTELTILVTLGTTLMSSRGIGDPEVEKILLRAWDLCRTLSGHPLTIPVLAGLWICYHLKGNLAQERFWVENLEHEVRTTSQKQYYAVVQFALTATAFYAGDFNAARQYGEQNLADLDSGQLEPQSSLFGYEPGIALAPGMALNYWLLGFPEQARKHMQHALALADKTPHPWTIAYSSSMAMVLLQWCGEISLTLDQAAKTIEYSTEKKILQWISHGRMLHGWALAHSGKVDRGVDLLRQGLAEWQAMGARRSLTYYLLILAETYTLSGRIEEGLNAVGDALAIIAEGGERWLEAELYRRQGELLLVREAGEQDVESCFQQALEIARLQQARSLELRAAMSLSRFWQRQGKHTAARKMLAKSYNWFSEGFDTADLRQARALLDAMG